MTVLDIPTRVEGDTSFFTYLEAYLRACTECGITGQVRNLIGDSEMSVLRMVSGMLEQPNKLVVFSDRDGLTTEFLKLIFEDRYSSITLLRSDSGEFMSQENLEKMLYERRLLADISVRRGSDSENTTETDRIVAEELGM